MFRESMTSRERVLASFKGEARDRLAVINPTSVANTECMRLTKNEFPYAHVDSVKMAELAAAGRDILKFDSVSPYFSICNEAAALGCAVDWGNRDAEPRVASSGMLKRMDAFAPPGNFLDRKPVKTILHAIHLLKKRYGGDVAVIGKVIGPLSLAFDLYGVQNMLTSLILEPREVKAFIGRIRDLVVLFAEAQIEAGADIITLSDDASGDLVSREGYRLIAMEANRSIHQAICRDAHTIFHLSGVIADKIDLIAEGGFHGISFDSRNDFGVLSEAIAGRMKKIGCVNNPRTLLNGSPADVQNEVFACIRGGMDLISPEGAIPYRVSNANLLAISDAVRLYAKIHAGRAH